MPEAVLGAQALILAAQVGGLAQIERKPHGDRAPARHCLRSASVWPSTARLSASRLRSVGALVGDIGGGRGAIEQQRALAVVARADLQHGARQPQPVRRVVRRHGDELAEHHHAGAEIAFLEGGVGVVPQGRGRLGHRAGVALDLRLELDRRVVEIAALEGLVGGERGNDGKGNERGGKAGADGT